MPPLEAAEAFLVAAQACSFRSAASQLALSPSAFSRRIQELERFVGIELFVRTSKQTSLTPAGRIYLAQVGPAIEVIRTATMGLREKHGERRIRIATSHSLASEWLMPRLPRLLAEHGIEVDLEVSRDSQLLRDRAVDLGVWGGTGSEPGLTSIAIAPMDAVPVAASRLADGRSPPRTVAELSEHRLLSDRISRWLWPQWLDAAGYHGARPQFVDHFETNQLCNEAAASGMGVALSLPLVSERFLDSCRLTACAAIRRPTGAAYYVHATEATLSGASTAGIVRDWLAREAAVSLDRFERWWAAAHSRTTL
jgi:LysR family glycine cleavage system transcriptional activator